MTIYDLQHRLHPEFPEVSANGEWEMREYIIRNGIRFATLIVADSEVGKEDILQFYGQYGITSDRIKVLSYFLPHSSVQEVNEAEIRYIRKKYCLLENYLFYPAQFWPHKNHLRLIKALGIIKTTYGLKIPIVFCGTNSGDTIREQTFKEVISCAKQLNLDKQLHFLGYIPDEDKPALYSGAVALAMPTFFGPTNIPFLEAWTFKCPVLTSNIRGIREQVNDAAVLVDPHSAEAIASGIYQLWTNGNLRQTLIEKGRQRLTIYSPEDYLSRLIDIIEQAKTRIRGKGKFIPVKNL